MDSGGEADVADTNVDVDCLGLIVDRFVGTIVGKVDGTDVERV